MPREIPPHKETDPVRAHLDEDLEQTESQRQKAGRGHQGLGEGVLGGPIGTSLEFCKTETF